jgi:hypothetical protein
VVEAGGFSIGSSATTPVVHSHAYRRLMRCDLHQMKVLAPVEEHLRALRAQSFSVQLNRPGGCSVSWRYYPRRPMRPLIGYRPDAQPITYAHSQVAVRFNHLLNDSGLKVKL